MLCLPNYALSGTRLSSCPLGGRAWGTRRVAAYILSVFHGDARTPTETVYCDEASRVLEVIPMLLKGHPDCAFITVYSGTTRLFAVDCEGNTLKD